MQFLKRQTYLVLGSLKASSIIRSKDDWTFLGVSTQDYTHGFHLYPARMHPEIARRIIAQYAEDRKKVVFDPFMGSGTTAMVAKENGRNYLGCELNPDYKKMQDKRINSVQYQMKMFM